MDSDKSNVLLGLGAAALVGVAVYYVLKSDGSAPDASTLIFANTKVRTTTDYAFEDMSGTMTALEWAEGQRRLGYQVGYDKVDGKLRLGRFKNLEEMKSSGMIPVPTSVLSKQTK